MCHERMSRLERTRRSVDDVTSVVYAFARLVMSIHAVGIALVLVVAVLHTLL